MSRYRRCTNCVCYKPISGEGYCKVKGILPLFKNEAKSCKYFEYQVNLSKIDCYRRSHHRCRYCHFIFYENKPERLGIGAGYYKCTLKDRIISDFILFSLRGMFCRWFEVGGYKTDEI